MRYIALLALFCLPLAGVTAEGEWSGYIAGEWRVFTSAPADPAQHGDNFSLSAQPEYYRSWNSGDQSFRFTPFLRIDGHDERRSHVDIRELNWTTVHDDWELTVGIGKVFWGVTESQHLVDIINQTDLVESPDGEEKLGQPMLRLTFVRDWGDVEVFLLPGFRERSFASRGARLRSTLPVATSEAEYASNTSRDHLDAAIRWSRSIGDWDIGLAHFSGTSREPRFRQSLDGAGRPVLVPVYETIDQTSLDLQATKGDWLWKLEVISRSGHGDRFAAATGGFEYTLYGVMESGADLGIIAEYLYDERGEAAGTPFEDDLFIGARLALNDVASSELLAGTIIDLDSNARAFSVEASRRFGNNWKLNLEARLFPGGEPADPLTAFRDDDFIQAELAWYF